MHEYSIVTALIEQCEQLAVENSAAIVSRVSIKVGVMSGVEPALLKTAFDTFKLDSICKTAELEMNVQPLVIKCQECGTQSELEERTVICPSCNGNFTKVVDGEDMMLMQLEMEQI
ncbi:hydrogenase maturation nickel metallochaperone HypA [Shewanella gelidii]|uniref:Hydrogenase maturation factor HypA n=1 Tax=Shewanella gelidii TaxID=1642821 RepID=A0A917JVK1_9GAMM|nr:hydrogenase maturation nickel metallochaperone HypA [Shewanella gelidii]MCL1098572.1 hydrogenase maturation nickel metallochaperone HypA [Shewanella gelidii]GGI86994.1 putative hydrogenase nickel incorporation protein HypA [Shewanella gelidii]